MYSTRTYKVKHEGRATEVFHFELCIMEMFNIEEQNNNKTMTLVSLIFNNDQGQFNFLSCSDPKP